MNTYYLYVLRHENALEIKKALKENGIGTGTYYPVPLNEQKALKDLVPAGYYPISKKMAEQTFAIPVFPELTKEEQDFVIDVLKKAER